MSSDTLVQQIETLPLDALGRLATALADHLPSSDLDAFEAAPVGVQELVRDLCAVADLPSDAFATLDEHTIVRRALADYASTPDGARAVASVLPHVADETMALDFDTLALSLPVLLAVGGLVFIEVDNAGPGGRIRWRVRLGRREGHDPLAKELLRAWLLRVGARASLPPSSEASDAKE